MKKVHCSLIQGESNIEQLLLNDDVSLKDACYSTDWKNVWILPSSSNLSGLVKALDGELGGHLVLKEKLSQSNDFEFFY